MEDSRNILGLDIGTNSIGWAVVKGEMDGDGCCCAKSIVDAGSRILPMDAEMMGDFARGNSISQTKDRTRYRGMRRLGERRLLRRERLHRVLMVLGFLPEHYQENLTRYGKFKSAEKECKLPWTVDEAGRAKFLFRPAYEEMLQLFWQKHPELMARGMKVPYDWTLYYLRKKALTEPVGGQELAWILLSFNQKRGYYQIRGKEQEEKKDCKLDFYELKVVDVVDTSAGKAKQREYCVRLENGMECSIKASEKPDWVGKVKEFVAITYLNEDGTPRKGKAGKDETKMEVFKEGDWGHLKRRAESRLDKFDKTVGAYIFEALLENPKQKIRGGLVQTIDREYYKKELVRILQKQQEFIPQLTDRELYEACVKTLYRQNEAYRNSISERDFVYLLVDDVIFYQRPLKSKKSLIDDCPYEFHEYKDEDGNTVKKFLKCIAKSHPLFQEFRLWQFVSNLRIYEQEGDAGVQSVNGKDVTQEFLPDEESRVKLFDYLNDLPSVSEEGLLKGYFKIKKPKGKDAVLPYRWNYVQDKSYPCNETRGEILARLKKASIGAGFLNRDAEEALWHILYSVSDSKELEKALLRYARHHQIESVEGFVCAFKNFPPFKSDYGAYSAKAIKRLLPLMRMGKYWSEEQIDGRSMERIHKIIDGEADDAISQRTREKTIGLTCLESFRGLPLWLACYVVYDRHGEAGDSCRWETPEDIDKYLKGFKRYSLRNPVVEQVLTETLRVVRDVWKKHGHIGEIHVELGRDLKNPAEKRAKMSKQMVENENTNLRIKALLEEFLNPEYGIENVKPYSPSQQELLKIYEETVLNSVGELDADIASIKKKFEQKEKAKRPSFSDVQRYKLWLEQKYLSPYTGQPISLARLFTSDYEIEHIIPQSKYFDDSLSNKVICEAEVNRFKGNALGYEFIQKCGGTDVLLNGGKIVRILGEEDYRKHVETIYKHNRAKMRKLLMEEIPDEFIERQLNDTRYVSKLIKGLLSNIVREEDEREATSKHVIVCSGKVTDRLKREWGVDSAWNHIILPRFERMNEKLKSDEFTAKSKEGHWIPVVPLALQKGFSKKRIDHRHHAMDAIVIACTTRNHVNLLSNEAALSANADNRRKLSRKLRRYEEVVLPDGKQRYVPKEFKKPWPEFAFDVENTLQGIVVSFKQNLRILTKTSNYFCHFVDGKKRMEKQTKGDGWAVRKPLHKETVYGEVNLCLVKDVALKAAMKNPSRIVDADLKREVCSLVSKGCDEKQIKKYFEGNKEVWGDIDLKKIKVYYFTKETSDRYFATRKFIGDVLAKTEKKGQKEAIEKNIKKITDTGIQKILLAHLDKYADQPNQAFTPEGIEEMNRNIKELNGGKDHQPIWKVRVYEKANKFAVGQKEEKGNKRSKGNKDTKFVEAEKGTNLFFAVTEEERVNEETGKMERVRSYRTIPLQEAIEKKKGKQKLDDKALFILSPNDLVYLPTAEERERLALGEVLSTIDKRRIYKMVSATRKECYFVMPQVAAVIEDGKEFGSLNKMERAITEEMIKEICVPLKVNRLGEVLEIGVKR